MSVHDFYTDIETLEEETRAWLAAQYATACSESVNTETMNELTQEEIVAASLIAEYRQSEQKRMVARAAKFGISAEVLADLTAEIITDWLCEEPKVRDAIVRKVLSVAGVQLENLSA